jgi:hypothetical protein
VQSEQYLCDFLAGVLGVFETHKDIAHVPSRLIRAIIIPLSVANIEQAIRQILILIPPLWSSAHGLDWSVVPKESSLGAFMRSASSGAVGR